MTTQKKMTVYVPAELLKQAQKATGDGPSDTVRKGLQLLAASRVYDRARKMKGKINFSLDLKKLREDGA